METGKRFIDAKPLAEGGWHLVKTGKNNVFLESMSLADVPAVDAVEVVHGRWVGHYDMSWIHKQKWLTGYDCSVCGRFIKTMTPYCPHCGAKMDGGNEDG